MQQFEICKIQNIFKYFLLIKDISPTSDKFFNSSDMIVTTTVIKPMSVDSSIAKNNFSIALKNSTF